MRDRRTPRPARQRDLLSAYGPGIAVKKLLRNFYWVVTIPLAVIVVVFAVSNREPVVVDIWPLPPVTGLPLFLFILGSFFIGLRNGVSLLMAISGSQGHVASTSASPLTADIRAPMSGFGPITSASPRTADVCVTTAGLPLLTLSRLWQVLGATQSKPLHQEVANI